MQQPRECDSCVRDAALLRNFRYFLDDCEIGFFIVHRMGKLVALGARGFTPVLPPPIAGEKATRERTPRNDANALLATERDHFSLFLAIDEIVMVLHRYEACHAHV